MKDSGLASAGRQYVNLDDFWYQCPSEIAHRLAMSVPTAKTHVSRILAKLGARETGPTWWCSHFRPGW